MTREMADRGARMVDNKKRATELMVAIGVDMSREGPVKVAIAALHLDEAEARGWERARQHFNDQAAEVERLRSFIASCAEREDGRIARAAEALARDMAMAEPEPSHEAREAAIWRLYKREQAENTRLRRDIPQTTADAYVRVLDACCKALDLGGVSASRLAELIGATVGELRRGGLQRVVNALFDAAETAALARAEGREALPHRLDALEVVADAARAWDASLEGNGQRPDIARAVVIRALRVLDGYRALPTPECATCDDRGRVWDGDCGDVAACPGCAVWGVWFTRHEDDECGSQYSSWVRDDGDTVWLGSRKSAGLVAERVGRAEVRRYVPEAIEQGEPETTEGKPAGLAPVPRGHCGRCDRCGALQKDHDTADRLHGWHACTFTIPRRTHCAGCGAPYETTEGK